MERVGVVGAGLMGSGIAEVCARAGCDVIVHEVGDGPLAAGRARVEKSLARAVERGKLVPADRDAALARLSYTLDLNDMADREIVVEAVTENEAVKKAIFATLDEVVAAPDAVLASNTSSIPITRLAAVTTQPGRVVGLHFFNPVPVMGLVELVTSPLTEAGTAERAEEFVRQRLGKAVIHAPDRGGFIVNMLLVPYLLGAMRMYEAGFATAADIDTGMKLGTSHPMGPLELSDFIGLDTMKAVADVLYDEYKEPFYAAPPLLVRMVEAGFLGRKTGRGFYNY